MSKYQSLHLLPRPSLIEQGKGSFNAPDVINATVGESAFPTAEYILGQAFSSALKDRVVLESESGIGWWLQIGEIVLPQTSDFTAESYRLTVEREGIALVASCREGFRHGMRTLLQLLLSSDTIPVMDIQDAPSIEGRAVMIDMVRLKERDEVYFRLLEEMADWKMNALFLHFIDNQGCTIELKSRPELVSPHAMSQETLAALIRRGEELGVRIIGEIESWGHAKWISEVYPELGEPGTNSLCLSQEGIYPIIQDVITEMAQIFPDPYLHIGCDEADFSGDCKLCPAAKEKVGELQLIANHINRVNRMAKDCGKTSMIWGDIILHRPEILPLLDKDIITEDWYYYTDVKPDGLRKLKEQGFRIWAAPALMMGSWRLTPAQYNLNNVRLFTEIARQEGAEGVATTVWLPQRYIPRTLGRGIAYAADLAWGTQTRPLDEVMADYLFIRFGLEPTEKRVKKMIRLGHAGQRNPSQAFWGTPEALAERISPESRSLDADYANNVRGLSAKLRDDLPDVKRNCEEYECLALAAEVAEHFADRRDCGAKVAGLIRDAVGHLENGDNESYAASLEDAVEAIRKMEASRAELFARMQQNWDMDRFEDSPYRSGDLGQTNNLHWWMGHPESFGFALTLMYQLEKAIQTPELEPLRQIAWPGGTKGEEEADVYVDS